MTSVYLMPSEKEPALLRSLVFWPNFRFEISPKRLFLCEIMAQYQEPFFRIVERPEEADFFAVPYEYFFAEDSCPEYLARVFALAKAAGKKVLLFDYTDYVDRTAKIPAHAILFRVSAYRHHKQRNEIVMPYFVEDIGKNHSFELKEKGKKASVGYCGQSRFGSALRRWRAQTKRFFSLLRWVLLMDPEPFVHSRGIFFRAAALALLRADTEITCNFIERSFYSLHRTSGKFDQSAVRREYIENLRENDFALCVRGDANNSQRLYETLSAGRIPLFVDTDCALPLEESIDYDSVMLRVHARDMRELPARMRTWWEGETEESFLMRQKHAREIYYEEYLRLDRFFERVFDRERSPYRDMLYAAL